ncbi:MAG TPA: hypothetical protein VGK67_04960 [Myxococcales bacterium]|jgi:hypothetical protein
MSDPNQPRGPTKIKGKQGVRQAAEGEEKLIEQLGEPSEPAPEAMTPPQGEPFREAGPGQPEGQGNEEGKP